MLSRRNFLKLGGAGAVVVMAGSTVPMFISQAFASGQPGASLSNGSQALVIVELQGGNDGLNTVIPFSDAQYYKLRPTLAIQPNSVLKLNSNVGLHPSMTGLQGLYNDGKLAIVQGVCYPNPSLSHFEASDIWQSAQPTLKGGRSGWVARSLDAQPASNTALAASLTGDVPMTLYSQTTLVPSISSLNDFNFRSDNYYDETDGAARLKLLRSIYQYTEQNSMADYVRSSALDALATTDALQQAAKDFKPAPGYPADSELASQLANVVQLLVSGLAFRIFYVRITGFDTHANQVDAQAGLLKDLSDSLTAFYSDLRTRGLADNVTVLSFSEFGRRAAENGSGTDHGTSQPMFVLGGKVKGGFYGSYPSLSDLDDDNLKFSTDFRSVYATVLEKWLKLPATSILGQAWSQLNLF
jgi:uncharacterized protein (DUF1501 family)